MKVSIAPLLKLPLGDRLELHVDEAPIDPHGENADLLEADVSAIHADIDATHTNPGALLEGDVLATVEQECSRCLRPIGSPVETHFAEQYYATLNVETGAPMPDPPLDAKVIGHDFLVDLTPLLLEEIILATPQAPLCRPDCTGLCPVCGADLNESPHEHAAAADERWSALRGLRVPDVKD